MLERFSRKHLGRVTGIGYTLEGKYNKRILNVLADEHLFYESFIILYGFARQKIYTKLKTFYTNTPYDRGAVFLYGSTIVQTPITLFVNLESRCINESDVERAIELINSGRYSLYISTPFTSNELTSLYRERIQGILKDLGVGRGLIHPSYSLVVGSNRLFRDSLNSLLGSEILVALMTEVVVGRDSIMIENNECIDQVSRKIKGFEKIYIEKLAKDVLDMLEARKVIDLEQKKRYLNMLVRT
ncbi:MAG: hypothetical protein QXW24_04340 [Ignisphaera sp.]